MPHETSCASGLQAALARRRARGEHQRRARVVDAAGVARRHHAALTEARRQLGQRLHRGLADAFVLVDHDLVALAVLDRDRRDLLGQPALLLGVARGLLAAQRVRVDRSRSSLLLLGQILRCDRHPQPQ